jgi:hypothetical protein
MSGGYPNAAVHGHAHHHHLPQSHAHTEQLEAMMSSLTNNNNQRQAAVGGVGGVGGGPRPPIGGGNPMVNYPQLPAVNVAPPLHSPGEYQYRFVQAPAFPNNNNQQQQSRHGNQSQLPAVAVYNSRPPAVSSMSGTPSQRSRNTAAATEQLTILNHQNSRELSRQQPPDTPTSVQYHLESTV